MKKVFKAKSGNIITLVSERGLNRVFLTSKDTKITYEVNRFNDTVEKAVSYIEKTFNAMEVRS